MVKSGHDKRIVQARNQEEEWKSEPDGQFGEGNIPGLQKFKEEPAGFEGLKRMMTHPEKAQNQ
jgi:hypothetical protein